MDVRVWYGIGHLEVLPDESGFCQNYGTMFFESGKTTQPVDFRKPADHLEQRRNCNAFPD
jgi:hypothetical protein